MKLFLNFLFVVKPRPESRHSQDLLPQLPVLSLVLHLHLLQVAEQLPRHGRERGLRGGPDDGLSAPLRRPVEEPEEGSGDDVAGDALVDAHVSLDIGRADARVDLKRET